MRNSTFQLSKKFIIILMTLSLSLMITPASAQQTIFTNKQLYDKARQAVRNENWVDAARFLTAYIQRNPNSIQADQQFAHALELNLSDALSKLDRALSDAGGAGADGHYLLGPPPLPAEPDAVPEPTAYPLVCRGGGALAFTYTASPHLQNPEVHVAFQKASAGVGNDWEMIDVLEPGECAWQDRAVGPTEPDRLIITNLEPDAEPFAVTWQAGRVTSLESTSAANNTLTEVVNLLQRSDGLQSFVSYNDGMGTFVVTEFGRSGRWSAFQVGYRVIHVEAGDHLNVRSRPGVHYSRVGSIPRTGSNIQLTGAGYVVNGSLWLPIQYETLTGWVNSYYLDTKSSSVPVPPAFELTRPLYIDTPQMSGLDVRLVERRLQALGYAEVGTVDGRYGAQTEAGVNRFQQVNDLEVDGVVGPLTWARLFSQEAIPKP